MLLIRKIPISPSFTIVARSKQLFAFSGALMIASLILFLSLGLNFGIDFRGGILLEVRVSEGHSISTLRDRTAGLGLGEITLQEFGNPQDVLINVERQDGGEKQQQAGVSALKEALGDAVAEYRRTEIVGPKVGEELKQAGLLATLLAIAGIGLYIWFRFEWQFSVAAIIALAHDVIATIGFFALTQIEFNLATLAAVLMIAGYSINDTVVIFDRVREMLRKYKKLAIVDVLNRAVNHTLSRTFLTSFTTLLALIALALFGGEVIRGFILGLIWGVIIGTYSSIGLAVPLLTLFKLRRGDDSEGAKEETGGATPAEAG